MEALDFAFALAEGDGLVYVIVLTIAAWSAHACYWWKNR